jgi:hypothetical protein
MTHSDACYVVELEIGCADKCVESSHRRVSRVPPAESKAVRSGVVTTRPA